MCLWFLYQNRDNTTAFLEVTTSCSFPFETSLTRLFAYILPPPQKGGRERNTHTHHHHHPVNPSSLGIMGMKSSKSKELQIALNCSISSACVQKAYTCNAAPPTYQILREILSWPQWLALCFTQLSIPLRHLA